MECSVCGKETENLSGICENCQASILLNEEIEPNIS